MVENLLWDMRLAARTLVRTPGFSAVTVLLMALGIAATATLFSLAYGVLLKPLPWSDPDRVVRLQETRGGKAGRVPWTMTNTSYHAWREDAGTIDAIGGWTRARIVNATIGTSTARLRIASITPSLFETLQVPPVAGRFFTDEDVNRGIGTIVLGAGLWQRRFGGRADVVGETLRLDGGVVTVVGIMPSHFAVPDRNAEAWVPLLVPRVDPRAESISGMIPSSRFGGVTDPPQPEMFFAYRQWDWNMSETAFVVRSDGDPGPLAPTIRAIANQENPSLTIETVATMEDLLMGNLARPRIYALLVAYFAMFATTVAIVGLFGVLSHVAAQRRREIGVRTALGATPSDILGLITRDAVRMTVYGLIVGLVAAFAVARSLATMLYGVSGHDAATFIVVPVVLILAATAACSGPAYRASRVSPMVALRSR